MPLEKLVLMIVAVLAAAGATIWVASLLIATVALPPFVGLGLLSVAALAGYIVWRVIAERVTNKDDDHYDKFEN